MVKPKMVKDKRLAKKFAARDLNSTVEKILTGEQSGRPGAEHHMFQGLRWLVQLYLMGEGALPDELRALVAALQDPKDPLRRDIPPDTWAMVWPALNTLTHARQEALETMKQHKEEATHGREERGEGEGPQDGQVSPGGEAPEQSGTGTLGTGSGEAPGAELAAVEGGR